MSAEHLDVLIVGAGISGICAGYHVQDKCPGRSYAILESRGAIGGTWDLFRYPGIRSDSDMYTLGFRFRPWPDAKTIADGPAIRKYVNETAAMYGIDEKIRFHRRVVAADWSGEDACWTVEVENTESGATETMTCNFLMLCGGYYRYDQPFAPEFRGADRFGGTIVHPQLWTDDVDYEGKRVVVIGSGATAVTLVPAMAERAAHVTMLQRSPSYVVSRPAEDPIAKLLRRVLPARYAYSIARWKNVALTMLSWQLSRRRPRLMKAILRRAAERQLPPGYDMDPHFRPRYNPWDQRLCLIPDGDLFEAICDGSASIVTDTIETFTETGIRLASGDELEADLIVTATGLNLVPMGGLELSVEGEAVHLPDHLTYKGLMLDDVPNMAFAIGYTNASWTLKCELSCEYACRLMNHMDEHGLRAAVPRRPPDVTPEPLIDFTSGYVQRSIHMFPHQGSRRPWRLYQNYALDRALLTLGDLTDEMEFSGAPQRERVAA